MDFLSFANAVYDNTTSLKFIESRCVKNVTCKFCKSKQIYIMKSRNQLRCKICKKDFKPFSNSKFPLVKISYSKWLALIKLFELSLSAKTASKQMQLDYKTTLRAFDIIRYSILEELAKSDRVLKGKIEEDEAYFGGKRKGNRGRGAKNKTIVFGILERNGKVHVEIVKNVKAKTLLASTIKKVRKGSIVYTDKWHGYDSLIFNGYKHLSVDHSKMFAKGDVYINGIEGFWSYAKENMTKYHGVSPGKFLLYIKEMEWRYNNRNKDLFDLLLKYMLGVEYT
jgi:transposase